MVALVAAARKRRRQVCLLLSNLLSRLMTQVLIRNLSDETVARLKAKAKARGITLQAILKESVERAATLTPAERLELLRRVTIIPARPEPPGQTLRDIAEGRRFMD
jgi:plasmid stability protein